MNSFTVLEEWQPILSGSFEEFRDGVPTVGYLQDGQEFKIVIKLEWWSPIAWLADFFLAEEFVATFLNVGGDIIDVWAEDAWTVVIWARANASTASTATQVGPLFAIPTGPIAWAIAGAIAAVGLAAAISLIIFSAKMSGEAASLIGMVVAVMIVVLMMSLIGKQLLPEAREEEARE